MGGGAETTAVVFNTFGCMTLGVLHERDSGIAGGGRYLVIFSNERAQKQFKVRNILNSCFKVCVMVERCGGFLLDGFFFFYIGHFSPTFFKIFKIQSMIPIVIYSFKSCSTRRVFFGMDSRIFESSEAHVNRTVLLDTGRGNLITSLTTNAGMTSGTPQFNNELSEIEI